MIVGPARVVDGDTIEIHDTMIRLWGIDAPEDMQLCDLGHGPVDIGDLATSFLETFIDDRPLACEQMDVDRYGRVVARCHIDRSGLGSAIVLAGLAWDYERYSGGAYEVEERLAREAGRGVWAGACETPWEWRQR